MRVAAAAAARSGVAASRWGAVRASSTAGALEGAGGRLWDVCVGLEVHAQILSATKLFSPAPSGGAVASAGAGPNECVALFDAALPGALPVLNRHCVLQAVRAGLMLGGEVQETSVFERKHYFYADLPSGYQITQNRLPIVRGGSVEVDVPGSNERVVVGLDRIQLEQDSGKSTHTLRPDASLLDLNRAGVALIEVVTLPGVPSGEAAGAFLRKMQAVLRHGGVCDGNMELGSMRCDVNVSLSQRGSSERGERVEMKNVASVRAVVRAVEHEARRQLEALDAAAGRGDAAFRVERETRSFDLGSGQSSRLRGKEDAPDYRFLPEPDLRPLVLPTGLVEAARATLPESLDAVRRRLEAPPHSLSPYDAAVIVGCPGAPRFFDEALEAARAAAGTGADARQLSKSVSNWLTSELLGRLSDTGGAGLVASGAGASTAFSEASAAAVWGEQPTAQREGSPESEPGFRWWSDECAVSPAQLGEVAGLVESGETSGASGKRIVALLFGEGRRGKPAEAAEVEAARGRSVVATVEALGLRQVSDEASVEAWCREAVALPAAAKALDKLAKGKDRAMGALVGLALKASSGRANPAVVAHVMPRVVQEMHGGE